MLKQVEASTQQEKKWDSKTVFMISVYDMADNPSDIRNVRRSSRNPSKYRATISTTPAIPQLATSETIVYTIPIHTRERIICKRRTS